MTGTKVYRNSSHKPSPEFVIVKMSWGVKNAMKMHRSISSLKPFLEKLPKTLPEMIFLQNHQLGLSNLARKVQGFFGMTVIR